ncbi:glycosyltransferase family 2 protein [Cellulosilyticum ruminicola]|uniref:glycosyltransferase family 2 protein n=1 Tax=Cellulosilyticum ruminicola TaxID=425254 RepID=UPI0006D18980|nr:galactosyltransferase-related protein [Cellulosilyticum ruminicola]
MQNHVIWGVAQAKGKYVVFIDADIIVNDNYLEELDRCYAINDNIIVAGGRLLMNAAIPEEICLENKLFKSNYLTSEHVEKEFREEVFKDLSFNGATMQNPFLFCFTCNLSVPRDEIATLGGFDEDLKKWGVEDVEMVYRLYQKGLKIVFNYRNTVVHQFHGNRQGKVVKKEQEEEVDYNSRIFSQKHIGAMGLDAQGIQRLFRSIATVYKELEKAISPDENCIQIDFKEANQLVQIKQLLKGLIAKKISHIVIYDYVEQTDLDIWIQLQETFGKQVKYYPISKII